MGQSDLKGIDFHSWGKRLGLDQERKLACKMEKKASIKGKPD